MRVYVPGTYFNIPKNSKEAVFYTDSDDVGTGIWIG